MAAIQHIDFTLTPAHGRTFSADARYKQTGSSKPVVIFIHGFKGFKDWGHFNVLADYFAENDFVFIKFNLSHNGVVPGGKDLEDMEAFAKNNFTLELEDVKTLIDALEKKQVPVPKAEINLSQINLMGHSRGGGLAILYTAEDTRVKRLATWAAISEIGYKWPDFDLEQWKKEGVQYVANDRLKIKMPLYYQLVEDFEKNRDRLDIPTAASKITVPFLIIHGEEDETLPLEMAHQLKNSNVNAMLEILPKTMHSFGGEHPFEKNELPAEAKHAADLTIQFFKS